MLQDLKFGFTLLWKEKAFTLTALLTLALCIGANTAIFTVLNAVILNPLPYPEPERLVTMYNVYPGVGVARGANGVPDYLDRRQMTDVFEQVALVGNSGYDVGVDGSPQRIDGQYVTPTFFSTLRVQPAIGRAFTEDEAAIGKEHVAVLGYGLWRQMFAGDRNALDKDNPELTSAIRRELQRADPEIPLYDVQTMPERLAAALLNRRATMILCLVFAGLALTLSAVGIYGVLAYTVTRRTREFGIRMALGAHMFDVLGMVAGHGLKLAGLGLAIGLAGSLAVTRLMTSLLYSVRPSDPIVFVAVVATLAAVALIASLIPSIRALRIRPADALRCE